MSDNLFNITCQQCRACTIGPPSLNGRNSFTLDCWSEQPEYALSPVAPYQALPTATNLHGTLNDMRRSRNRIDPRTAPVHIRRQEDTPTTFTDPRMTNRQKRIVLYQKSFEYFYPNEGRRGHQVALCRSIAGCIRTAYPAPDGIYAYMENM